MAHIRTNADRHFLALAGVTCLLVIPLAGLLYLRGTIGNFNVAAAIDPIIGNALPGNRSIVYGTLASIYASLLGFTITVTSIILGLASSSRFTVMRESTQYETLWNTLNATVRVLAASTIVSLGCLLFDRDQAPNSLWVVALVSVVSLSIAYLWRSLWILENVVRLVTRRQSSQVRPATSPTIS